MNFFFEQIPAAGSILNAGAVVLGSLVGLAFHSRLPQRYIGITFHGLGLLTLFLGVFMAQKTQNFLILAFSIVIGSIAGEFLDLDRQMNRLAEWTKAKIRSKNEKFTEGFMASSLLFCVGSMAILGALEEGMGGVPRLYVTKSLMDLAASLGIGVLFSAIPVLLYQGGMTLLAGTVQTFMTQPVIDEVSAAGGLLLIGIALSVLEIKTLKVINMLPALLAAGILASLFS